MSRQMNQLAQQEKKDKKLRKKHGEEPSTKEKLVAYLKGSHNYKNMETLVKGEKKRTLRARLKERLAKAHRK
jgi:hypothetical protein